MENNIENNNESKVMHCSWADAYLKKRKYKKIIKTSFVLGLASIITAGMSAIIATGFKTNEDEESEAEKVEETQVEEEPEDKFKSFNPFGYNAQAQQKDVRVEQNLNTSRVDVNPSSSIPPWIEKIRNKNKK